MVTPDEECDPVREQLFLHQTTQRDPEDTRPTQRDPGDTRPHRDPEVTPNTSPGVGVEHRAMSEQQRDTKTAKKAVTCDVCGKSSLG